MRLTAEQMRSLPSFFSQISDPRRAQGRRHRLSMVLGIAAGAVLCGMRGYQAISDWAQSLGQKSRSEEHTSELQSRLHLVCRLLLEKKNILMDFRRFASTQQYEQPAMILS